MNNQERVDYYTANLNKEWNITFCENTEICNYDCNGINLTYVEQSNPKCYPIFYINKDFSVNHFDKLWWNKYEKIKHDKKLGRKCVWKAVNGWNKRDFIEPLIKLFKSDNYFKNYGFLHRPGDVVYNTTIPIITKTRPIEKSIAGFNCKLPFQSVAI